MDGTERKCARCDVCCEMELGKERMRLRDRLHGRKGDWGGRSEP